ncbi:hypothetical protein [Haloprofundus salinisoli]|uniref:hypothetical protein n=1 Tax=Haloprofundus salinisoli TaxID=2876193 RepID=UPI001CCCE228|nr:hypothetical protein [Haloprofundus salinisoli]
MAESTYTGDENSQRIATRVVLSHPENLSDWGRDQISTDRYRGYLRRKLDSPAVGDTFETFVDTGCCGNSLDVPFRVEALDGGDTVGEETTVEYVERDETMEGGWRVQSKAGPTE